MIWRWSDHLCQPAWRRSLQGIDRRGLPEICRWWWWWWWLWYDYVFSLIIFHLGHHAVLGVFAFGGGHWVLKKKIITSITKPHISWSWNEWRRRTLSVKWFAQIIYEVRWKFPGRALSERWVCAKTNLGKRNTSRIPVFSTQYTVCSVCSPCAQNYFVVDNFLYQPRTIKSNF